MDQQIRPLAPAMRLMLFVATGLVFIAGFQLFVLSDQTARFFAWTIKPSLTAAFLGAGYWASCGLELLAARRPRWDQARVAVPAVFLFTSLTFVATLLHLDKFHFSSADPITLGATWAWVIVYGSVPLLMLVALAFQLRVPGRDGPREAPIPTPLKGIILAQGLVMVVLGIALFVMPASTLAIWPWALTPLTARAVGAWLIGLGAAGLTMVREGDWLRVEAAIWSIVIFAALELVAIGRYASSVNDAGAPVIDWGGAGIWVYLAFILSLLGIGIYSILATRRSRRAVAVGAVGAA